MSLRLLIVHPGADYSVHDVYVGLAEALTRAGHSVGVYALNGHMEIAARYLAYQQHRLRRLDPSEPRRAPLPQVMLKASEGTLLTALRGRADAVLVISALYFHPQALYMLRAARIPVGLVFTESPYQDEEQFKYAELASCCWTNERTSVDPLRQANPRTWYLPAAYRAGLHVLRPQADDDRWPAHDVVFLGTLFKERAELLAAVNWSGIDFGLYGNLDAIDRRSAAYRTLKPHVRGGVLANPEAMELYRRAKIVLNPYRTTVLVGHDWHVTTGESLNPRAYECAAGGIFSLTGERAESAEVFGANQPSFATATDLEARIRWYLHRPIARRTAAVAAHRQVIGQTFDARAAQLVEQLTSTLLHNPYVTPAAALAAD